MLLKELLYALRRLHESPVFSLTAIVTLALGIGASTAVFTVVDSVVFKPLSYRDSEHLVTVWERVRFLSFERTGPNPRHFDLWQQRSTAFSDLTLLEYGTGGLVCGTEHPQLVGTVASYTNLFETLQVAPILGRSFRPDDGVPGHDNVAILTYPLWQKLFSGDMNVIGKTFRLADTPRQVIGVLPASFHFPNANELRPFSSRQSISSVQDPDVFVPASVDLNQFGWNGDYGHWVALGRLKVGTSLTQAETQLNAIEAVIIHDVPGYEGDHRSKALAASVQPMQETVVGNIKTALWFLLAAVIGLLFIACVNLANAQLGRAISREGEAAVRSALGASKIQVLWSLLSESLLLATAGGVIGMLFAVGTIDVLLHYSPVDVPRLSEVHLNVSVLCFAVALTAGSTLLFGIVPGLKFCRVGHGAALQDCKTRRLGTRQGRRLRMYLIGLQVSGCTVLLLVTGLFLKSLLHLLRENKGFETEHIVVAEASLSPKLYASDQSRTAFIDSVLAALRTIPGVQSAGFVSAMPLEGETWTEGLSRVDKPALDTLPNLRWVSPGYFETMRVKLLVGRFFEERDRILNSAVISEGVAKALWQNESPLGTQVEVEQKRFTVIGVVGDTRSTSLKSAPAKMAYLHYVDRPPFTTLFTVRGSQPAHELTSAVRQAIWHYAPNITIARIKTLDSQVSDSLAAERFQTSLLVAFGLAALLLSVLGIYAVLSYSVTERTQEIAVRIALGASRRKMYSLILMEAEMPVFSGLAAGLTIGALVTRLVQHLFYGINGFDLPVTAAVAALFVTSAFIGAFVPASRAACVNPIEVLRAQ
jgi:predicted permease